jgi:hypothetical protein
VKTPSPFFMSRTKGRTNVKSLNRSKDLWNDRMDIAIDVGIVGRDMGLLILKIEVDRRRTDPDDDREDNKSGDLSSSIVLICPLFFHSPRFCDSEGVSISLL